MTRDYFVNASELLHLRDQEIRRFTGGSEDFKNAFSWIASEVGDVAYRWFAGDVLDPHDLGKLGVSGPLMSAQMAKLGLQLLAAHCGQTGTVFHPRGGVAEDLLKLLLTQCVLRCHIPGRCRESTFALVLLKRPPGSGQTAPISLCPAGKQILKLRPTGNRCQSLFCGNTEPRHDLWL